MECLSLVEITKVYPNGVLANDRVNFTLQQGEIHAIIGENGAGKSTVMKVLYGMEKKDGGTIYLEGKQVEIHSPADAIRYGISMVPQHPLLINEMTVSENVFLGIEKARHTWLDKAQMSLETQRLCEKYKLPLDPDAHCGDLSASAVQKVGILKALVRNARILILDEPTSVLAPQETEELFNQLLLLRENEHSIIIITHKLQEVKRICDRVTILRAGKNCGVFDVKSISEEEISALMVGGELLEYVEKPDVKPGEPILEVRGLSVARENKTFSVNEVNFTVRRGEIVCFVGLEGNGQQDTVSCITGLQKEYQGEIKLLGKDLRRLTIRQIREAGLAHIPEDRQKTGSNTQANVLDNLVTLSVRNTKKSGLICYRKLKHSCRDLVKKYQIRIPSLTQPLSSLSGGNIQKVILARELASNFDLLVADQPTRGLDAGSTEFIHSQLIQLREHGKGVLLVSSDLGEALKLADRILIFHDGKINAQITDVQNTNEEILGRYMLGLERMPERALSA